MSDTKKKNSSIVILVAAALFCIIYFFVPAVGGLTPAGVKLLAVFIPTVILWIGVGSGWPSLFATLFLALVGVFPMATILNITIGHYIPQAIIAFGLVNIVMEKSGLMNRIAKWLVSREITRGRPWLFLAVYMFGIMIVGVVFSQVMTMLMFVAMSIEVCKIIGYKAGDKFYTAMLLIPLWLAITAEGVFPIGKGVGMSGMGIFENLGYTFVLGDHMRISFPWIVLYTIAGYLVLKYVLRPDVSKFADYDPSVFQKELKANPMTTAEKVSGIGYIILLLIWVMPSLSFIPVLPEQLSALTTCWPPFLFALVFSVLRFDGEPLLDLEQDWNKVGWGIAWFCGTVLTFSAAMGVEGFGIGAALTNLLKPLLSSGSAFVIIAVGILICLIATNFISNIVSLSVVMTAFIPALGAMSNGGAALPSAFTTGIILVASVSFLTPAASPLVPIVLGKHISIKDALLPSGVLMLLAYVITVLCVTVLG